MKLGKIIITLFIISLSKMHHIEIFLHNVCKSQWSTHRSVEKWLSRLYSKLPLFIAYGVTYVCILLTWNFIKNEKEFLILGILSPLSDHRAVVLYRKTISATSLIPKAALSGKISLQNCCINHSFSKKQERVALQERKEAILLQAIASFR